MKKSSHITRRILGYQRDERSTDAGRQATRRGRATGICVISRDLDPHAARSDPRVLCKAIATHCSFRTTSDVTLLIGTEQK